MDERAKLSEVISYYQMRLRLGVPMPAARKMFSSALYYLIKYRKLKKKYLELKHSMENSNEI